MNIAFSYAVIVPSVTKDLSPRIYHQDLPGFILYRDHHFEHPSSRGMH
jgi:hypothetical protein